MVVAGHPLPTGMEPSPLPGKSYLYDVAFQKHVIKEAFPQYTVSAHLIDGRHLLSLSH